MRTSRQTLIILHTVPNGTISQAIESQKTKVSEDNHQCRDGWSSFTSGNLGRLLWYDHGLEVWSLHEGGTSALNMAKIVSHHLF